MCPDKGMTLTPANEVVVHQFQFVSKMGGGCVKVNWNGFQENAALKVEVRHTSKDIVDQINLGLAGSTYSGGSCWKFVSGNRSRSCVQERVGALEQSAEGWWTRSWQLPSGGYGTQGDGIFVVSNVALDPWKTKNADGLEIRFSFQRSDDQTGVLRAPPAGMHLKIGMPVVPSRGDLRRHDPGAGEGPGYLLVSNTVGVQEATGDEGRPSYWQYRTYGINPDPSAQQTLGANLLPISPIVIPKGDGPDAIERARYIVTPSPAHPLPLGTTGPLHGFVLYDEPPESESSGRFIPVGKIGSVFCPSAEEPIGRVLVNTADLLKVHVQTDLCTFRLTSRRPVVVERLDVIAVLPFGWRYQEPAPTVAVTAGVDYYVKRFFDRVEGRLQGDWPFGNPRPEITGSPGQQESGSPTQTATGSGEAHTLPPACDCSCEGYKTMEALSKRRDPAAKEEMKAFMPCMRQCMTQWTPCMQQRR
jgi:hypothetical protein